MSAGSVGNIREFNYLVPLENLESVMELGILSHNCSRPYKTVDVSMDSVQQIRATKTLPAHLSDHAMTIHDFANCYFNGQNPMLSSRRELKDSMCVLRIRPEAIDLPGAIVSDRNAAVYDAQFFAGKEGLAHLKADVLFGKYWTSKYNSVEQNRLNGQYRCAELLVPNGIHPSFIGGMYVSSMKVRQKVEQLFGGECPVDIVVHPEFFFSASSGAPMIQPLCNRRFSELQPFTLPALPQDEPVLPLMSMANQVSSFGSSQIAASSTANRTFKRSADEMNEGTRITAFFHPLPKSEAQDGDSRKKARTKAVASPGKQQVLISSEKVAPGTPDFQPIQKQVHVSPQKGIELFVQRRKNRAAPMESVPYSIDIPPNIRLKEGNLLNSSSQTLVNTVNCVGAMGKGIALQFKKSYKPMYEDYRRRCQREEVKPGVPYLYRVNRNRMVINFPTKNHWRNKSELRWIETGLDLLVEQVKEWGVTSLAVPALGCGNGGLEWRVVRALMFKKLGTLDIPVEIYAPSK